MHRFIVYGFSLLAAGLIVWFLMPSQAALEAERDAIMEAATLAEGKGTGVLPRRLPPLLTLRLAHPAKRLACCIRRCCG